VWRGVSLAFWKAIDLTFAWASSLKTSADCDRWELKDWIVLTYEPVFGLFNIIKGYDLLS